MYDHPSCDRWEILNASYFDSLFHIQHVFLRGLLFFWISHGFQIHLRAFQLYKGASQRHITLAHPKTFTQHCVNIYWKTFTQAPCKCKCKNRILNTQNLTLACTTLHLLTLPNAQNWAWLVCSGAILLLGFSQFV